MVVMQRRERIDLFEGLGPIVSMAAKMIIAAALTVTETMKPAAAKPCVAKKRPEENC